LTELLCLFGQKLTVKMRHYVLCTMNTDVCVTFKLITAESAVVRLLLNIALHVGSKSALVDRLITHYISESCELKSDNICETERIDKRAVHVRASQL